MGFNTCGLREPTKKKDSTTTQIRLIYTWDGDGQEFRLHHRCCRRPHNEAFGTCRGYLIEGYHDGGRSSGSSGGSAISPEGWRFNICKSGRRCKEDPLDGVSRWYWRLWDDPVFQRNLRNRWAQLRAPGGPLEQSEVDALLTEAATRIRPAAARNYNRWGNQAGLGDSRRWAREVQDLQTWLQERLSWMDGALTPTVAYDFP